MSEATAPRELVEAVEDDPEAVADLLARLGLDDAVAESDDEALSTDDPVRLRATVEGNDEHLAGALETLARLERDGTLDDLAAAGEMVSLLAGAADDEMVESLADTGRSAGELADAATDEDVQRGLEGMLEAVGEAERADPDGVGALGLLRATRDPEVRAGLGYLLALSRALGRQHADKPGG